MLLLAMTASADKNIIHRLAPEQAARRRSTTTRVRPAPSTELPYDSKIENGRGWNHHTEQFASHAFEEYTADLHELDQALDVHYSSLVVTDTSEFNNAMSTTAFLDFSGWGAKARADFAFDREVTMQMKDALFVLHASKDLGFEGWSFEDLPPFTESAKSALCNQGTFTPDTFAQLYGTYFVQGVRMATALDVFVKLETSTSESSEKVSASLEASWSGFGVKVGAGMTFSQTLEETLEHNSVSVTSKAYGVERDWIPNANVDNLDEIVEEYNSVSNEGSGIALTLSRYDDHPDYIEIEMECGSTFESLEHDEYLAEKYVDVAVEAKLFAEELLSMPYTSCGIDLAQAALTL